MFELEILDLQKPSPTQALDLAGNSSDGRCGSVRFRSFRARSRPKPKPLIERGGFLSSLTPSPGEKDRSHVHEV
jgi:hypothetical protein